MDSDPLTKEEMDLMWKKLEQSEEDIARMEEVLRHVREEGHPYVDIREEKSLWGNRFIFFCAVCREHCDGEDYFKYHLNYRSHRDYAFTARRTLLRPSPWPFNDGMLFFHDHKKEEQSKSLPASDKGKGKLLETHNTAADSLAKVKSSNTGPVASDKTGGKHIGVGKIGARLLEKDGVSIKASRIWCEWLGNVDSHTEEVPIHEFAVVTFSCTDIGSKKICAICKYGMSPNKDVAALLNMKTRKFEKLLCSTRNYSGAFHQYHVSCLIQWILIFEVEKLRLTENETKSKDNKAKYSFSSIPTDFTDPERKHPLFDEISMYRNKVCSGQRGWMESPEKLDNCSLGFHFYTRLRDLCCQETVAPLKILYFHRADDESIALQEKTQANE